MIKQEKCKICKKKKAELTFSESTMDFIHGFKKRICKECYKKILLERKESIEKTLKSLEEGNLK